MEAREILELVKAGFTKEEIMVLAKDAKKTEAAPEGDPQPKEEKPKEEKPKEEKPEETPAANPQEAVNAAVKEALKPFEDLYDHMAKLAGMPSIDNIQPKSIDDIVDNFFKGE